MTVSLTEAAADVRTFYKQLRLRGKSHEQASAECAHTYGRLTDPGRDPFHKRAMDRARAEWEHEQSNPDV